MAGSQRQKSLLTCDILSNGLTLLLLTKEQCQPRCSLDQLSAPGKFFSPVRILLSSAAEDTSLTLEEKIQWVLFQNMHNLAKVERNEKFSTEKWNTILWRLQERGNHKRWMTNGLFREGIEIWEASTSVCEQINWSAGKHVHGITKGLEGQSLQWLSTSCEQSSKPGPYARHMWWTWHSTKCSSAQAKVLTAAAEQTKG